MLLYSANSTKGVVLWKLGSGTATDPAQFGDPTAGTSYQLCVYDDIDGTPTLTMDLAVPAGGHCIRGPKRKPKSAPCWVPVGRKIVTGFRYVDKGLSADGVQTIWLRSNLAGGSIFFRAKGANVPMPPAASPARRMDQDPTITIQLSNSAGFCWESVYPGPAQVNKSTLFRERRR